MSRRYDLSGEIIEVAEKVIAALVRVRDALSSLMVQAEFIRRDTAAGFWLFPDAENPNKYLFVKPLKLWPAWVPRVLRSEISDKLYDSYYYWKDQATAERIGREQAIEEAKRRLLQSIREPGRTEPAVERIAKNIQSIVAGKSSERTSGILSDVDDDDMGALEALRLVDEFERRPHYVRTESRRGRATVACAHGSILRQSLESKHPARLRRQA